MRARESPLHYESGLVKAGPELNPLTSYRRVEKHLDLKFKLERFYKVRSDSVVCALTGSSGAWCQLYVANDRSMANFVPLAPKLDASRMAGSLIEMFPLETLRQIYEAHVEQRRTHLAYACARIALASLKFRAGPGLLLPEVVDWVRRAIHAVRHSFEAEAIRHTLYRDLLWRPAREIDRPETAYRLAMELAALLNERGHQTLARAFVGVATKYLKPQEVERLCSVTKSYALAADYYRRVAQIRLHTRPQDGSWDDRYKWDDFLKQAGNFVYKREMPFLVVEANLRAVASFLGKGGFRSACARYEDLIQTNIPNFTSIGDIHTANIDEHAYVTNAAAQAELFLFSGLTIAAARGQQRLAIAYLKLSDNLFDKTSNHALSPFMWKVIDELRISNSNLRERISDIRLRRTQSEGLSKAALKAIAETLKWLADRGPVESRLPNHVTYEAKQMEFNNPHFAGGSHTFNENQAPQTAIRLSELTALIDEVRKLQIALPREVSLRSELESRIVDSEAQVTSPAPNKSQIAGALGKMLSTLRSLSAPGLKDAVTEVIKSQIETAADRLGQFISMLT